MMLRVFICDVCGKSEQEKSYGFGMPGWGALHGVAIDGVENPVLCPEHKTILADKMQELKDGLD